MNKLITAVSVLQLVDRNLVTLDQDVRQIIPRLKDIQIVTGVDEEGKPVLEDTTKRITVR